MAIQGRRWIWPLKNEASERRISVDKLTLTVLKELILKVKNDEGNENQLVFYHPDSPIQVVTNDRLNDLLRHCIRNLQITPMYKGISLLYVSERLGHASLDITTSTYAHFMKEQREKDSRQTTGIFERLFNV